MKICHQCGNQNPDTSKFCGTCGYHFPDQDQINKSLFHKYWDKFILAKPKNKIIVVLVLLVSLCCICILCPTTAIGIQTTNTPIISLTPMLPYKEVVIPSPVKLTDTQIVPVTEPQNAIATTQVPEPTIQPSLTPTIEITSTVIISPTKVSTGQAKTLVLPNIPSPIPTQLSNTKAESGNVHVSIIDVGQGDSILIRSPEGLFGLIDGGEADSGAVQYLHSIGVQKLDLMVATHPHSDHIGGLVSVLKTFPTARVVTNGVMHTTGIYESFLDAISASKAEYIEVKRGNVLKLGSLTFDVLNPGQIVGSDLNRNSVVLRMTYGKTTFLFVGDANNDTESEMIAAGLPLSANILKVGHHGSRTSSSTAFLTAVHPELAVYSAGKGNSYGHPSPDTLARLSLEGAKILGTDVNGTIVIDVDGSGYSVHSAKQGQAQAPPVAPILVFTPSSDIQTPSSGDVSIGIVSLTSPISVGSTAQLTIQTVPGANCSITVYYKSGPSKAAGLGPQIADASGKVTWSWKVSTRTTRGIWKIVVQSNQNGKLTKLEIPFEVK